MERTSERLLLRQWRLDDFEPVAEFYANEPLARFVGGPCDHETAWRKIAMLAGHWHLRGHGYWAVEEKASGDFCGAVGLWKSHAWPELELGYWLIPAKFGRGYATEAGAVAIDFARNQLGAATLVSYIEPDNAASMKVAQRLGATREGTINLASFGPHRVFRYPL